MHRLCAGRRGLIDALEVVGLYDQIVRAWCLGMVFSHFMNGRNKMDIR